MSTEPAIEKLLTLPDDVEAMIAFDANGADLNQEQSEDARDFANQLVAAHSVFGR
jgi:hypothetical protein